MGSKTWSSSLLERNVEVNLSDDNDKFIYLPAVEVQVVLLSSSGLHDWSGNLISRVDRVVIPSTSLSCGLVFWWIGSSGR